ncbi:MAG: hypothetical protein KatS3mg051_2092 [Anaerolineae bacterium]|nr:MAG: hypothetical protein KatS3mg051_2092 [Anaerolineae bacterium]
MTNVNQEPLFYTPEEVSEILRVAVKTVYRRLQAGELPAVRLGRQYRIPAEALTPSNEQKEVATP